MGDLGVQARKSKCQRYSGVLLSVSFCRLNSLCLSWREDWIFYSQMEDFHSCQLNSVHGSRLQQVTHRSQSIVDCFYCLAAWKSVGLRQMQQLLDDAFATPVIQVSNNVPHCVIVQNLRNRMKLFYEIVQQNREKLNPSLLPSSSLPLALSPGPTWRTSWMTMGLLKCICLHCPVRNWISQHHMLPTQTCHCNWTCILSACSISH